MSPLKAILIAFGFALVLLLSMTALNFVVDPMCTYHCESIDLNRRTANEYYQVAQRILAHPDATQVLLGSSRSVSTPPLELEKLTHLQTISLGAYGADMLARIAILNFAKKNLQLKKVIWYADYFEIIPDRTESKLTDSAALSRELAEGESLLPKKKKINFLGSIIDHDTLNASIFTLTKVDPKKISQSRGGSESEAGACDVENFKPTETVAALQKKIDQYYENYTTKILADQQSEALWNFFVKKLEELSQRGIETDIYVPPYQPNFSKRLAAEYPQIYRRHLSWIEKLKSLSIDRVRVHNFFAGIPGDDGSPNNWTDGVHFTCLNAKRMLEEK